MKRLSTAFVALSALLASCVSSDQYRSLLEDKESENKALRAERTGLKEELKDANYQRDSLETALAEANAKLLAEPEKSSAQSYPGLDEAGVGYGTRDGNLVLTIPTEISFPSGKAELSKQGQKALTAVAKTLTSDYSNAEYRIEGHTDTDPIKKSKFETNRDLSYARAKAVLHYLVEQAGVPDNQCVVSGMGEYRPVAANDSPANKGKNRRVEITVVRR